MTLAAITALDAIVTMLNSQADERFVVIGYQLQKKAAESSTDKALVQCWIDRAAIDWSRSSRNGPKQHEVTVKVQFTVAQPLILDIATLQDPGSTPAQREQALQNVIGPAQNASNTLYNAWSAVFEIFDDARNKTFGLPAGSISDKSYSDFRQDEPPPKGGLGILTAVSVLDFRVKEAQLGDVGNQPDQVINDTNFIGADLNGVEDEFSEAGVIQKNPETI